MNDTSENPLRIDFRMHFYPGGNHVWFDAAKKEELKDVTRLLFELMRSGMSREEIIQRLLRIDGTQER